MKKPKTASASGGPAKVAELAKETAKEAKRAIVPEAAAQPAPVALSDLQVRKAVDALLKHLRNAKAAATGSKKVPLLDENGDDEFLYLVRPSGGRSPRRPPSFPRRGRGPLRRLGL